MATDAPSHARHCIDVLRHGKHAASAVPAVFGSLDDADKLLEAVKSSGRKYMMFETSAYHEDCHAMRQIYRAGGFGKLIYAEGEYFHYMPQPIASFKGWRVGLPPQWYPTHSNAYYVCVTDGSFTEVSCMAMPSVHSAPAARQQPYKNPFGTEIALFRTERRRDGADGRQLGQPRAGGGGRPRPGTTRGDVERPTSGDARQLPDLAVPPLPPGVEPGGHGGSHGHLMNEFVTAILEDRRPLVDIYMALNLTVAGVVAHQSAVKDGGLLKIPQYQRPV